MKELVEKLSSYNLFNYLLPGVVFVVLLEKLTSYNLLQNNILSGAFLYYFIGLVISRFGSLVVEPIFQKMSFIKFVSYKEFVAASRKDEKINLFSEVNNMYRTLIAMLLLITFLKFYELIEISFDSIKTLTPYILIIGLIIIFIFSYKKQTEYVIKRVNTTNKKEA